MDWFKRTKKQDRPTRAELVDQVLKYFEQANRDADTATINEKGVGYSISITCSVDKKKELRA